MMKSTVFTLLLVILTACAGSEEATTERGSGYGYREGFPEMRVSAIGFFDDDDTPSIQVVADIVKGSLVYKSEDGLSIATATVSIQVVKLVDKSRTGVSTIQIPLTVEGLHGEMVRSSDIYTVVQTIPVSPGDFEILMTITDNASNQQTGRKATTTIPLASDSQIGMTSIRMYGTEHSIEDGVRLITTHDVQNRLKGLLFENQFLVPESIDSAIVAIRLIRYDSDVEAARQMAGIPINPGSIQYKGIETTGGKTVHTESAVLFGNDRPLLVRQILPIPEPGNYRLQISITQPDGTTETRAREFGVKSAWYPNVRSIREMAEPLVYLMNRKDYEAMLAIQDLDSLKKAVDAFWLTNIKSRSKAGQVIELYYSRVEEANKQFSNFKEGWKTDMGMVFILFGPPWYVENSLDSSIWYYTYNRNDARYMFRFYRPRVADSFYPYQHYILLRERYYHTVEYEMVENWKSGYVLTNQ
jgi:GWxTD domain-containing protein